MSDLSSLIARLEAAEGPSSGLDAEISAVVEPHLFDAPGFTPVRPIPSFRYDPSENVIRFEGGGLMDVRFFPPVTSSIDAAVSLAERVVAKEGRKLICFFCAGGQLTPYNAEEGSPDFHPKAKIDNSVTVGWMSHVAFYNEDGTSEGDPSYSHGRTAALAICLSTLRALQQKGSSNG